MIGNVVGMATLVVPQLISLLLTEGMHSSIPRSGEQVMFLGAWKQDLFVTLKNVSSEKARLF